MIWETDGESMMKIVITDGAGFIGSNLTEPRSGLAYMDGLIYRGL